MSELAELILDGMHARLGGPDKARFFELLAQDIHALLPALREVRKVIERDAVQDVLDHALNSGDGSYRP